MKHENTCATCDYFEIHESELTGNCCIRSTDGPFPFRNADNWCGEWKEIPKKDEEKEEEKHEDELDFAGIKDGIDISKE